MGEEEMLDEMKIKGDELRNKTLKADEVNTWLNDNYFKHKRKITQIKQRLRTGKLSLTDELSTYGASNYSDYESFYEEQIKSKELTRDEVTKIRKDFEAKSKENAHGLLLELLETRARDDKDSSVAAIASEASSESSFESSVSISSIEESVSEEIPGAAK